MSCRIFSTFQHDADDINHWPVFFIVFRETVETAIVVAVLLSLIDQILGGEKHGEARKLLVRQVSITFSSRPWMQNATATFTTNPGLPYRYGWA